MIEYTVYDKTSGMILRTGYCPDDQFSIQAQGNSISEGIYPDNKYYWENGEFIEIPLSPGDFYNFDYETKSWVYDTQQATNDALSKRQKLLLDSDYTQLPDVPLDDKQAWAAYRQELRDITSQPNFPHDIIWPTKPTEGA